MPQITETALEPQLDYVLLRVIEDEETPGGIALPQRREEQSSVALVAKLGPGGFGPDGKHVPIDELKRGDTVLFRMDPESFEVGPGLVLVRSYCCVAIIRNE